MCVANPETVWELLQAGAVEAPAIGAPGRADLTFGGLREQVAAAVKTLNGFGLGRGDRIGIVLPNGPEMAATFLSVTACATAAPLNPGYTAGEVEFYLSDLGARGVILLEREESPVREVATALGIPLIELTPTEGEAGRFRLTASLSGPPPSGGYAQSEDVALVLHTSGTTSRPKIVPLTQRNICTSAQQVRETLRVSPADRCLDIMPLFHIHGLIAAVLSSLLGGGSVFCCPPFSGRAFFDWMVEGRPSWYTAVPSMHQIILGQAEQHADSMKGMQLRFIRSSSSSLPPTVMAELEAAFGAPVIESYGMTEAAHQMTSNPLPPGIRKPGTVGVPAGPEVSVMNAAGDLLPAGSTGEIVIRGPNVTSGYENNLEANAEAFTHGWLRTGDQGVMDTDGYLTITGRLKEIINRGGEKISPREIDEVLLTHPAIAQVVTFAMPDDVLGEEVAVAVVLQPGADADPEDIRAYAAERLARFKVPKQIKIVDEIPKGATGKIQRIGMAQRLGIAGSVSSQGSRAD